MMDEIKFLGRSSLQVPRLGVGVMTWGAPKGLARFTPASWLTAGQRAQRKKGWLSWQARQRDDLV